jgi:hypothetical protein
MLRIEAKTGLLPEDVINRAVKYFGGLGLKVQTQSPTSVYLEGGGGGVQLSALADKNITTVEFVSTEWDFQVKEFIAAIKDKKAAPPFHSSVSF